MQRAIRYAIILWPLKAIEKSLTSDDALAGLNSAFAVALLIECERHADEERGDQRGQKDRPHL